MGRKRKFASFLQTLFCDPYRFIEQEQDSPKPIEVNSTAICRRDGWTPFARRLFLEVLAETGRVSRACDFAGLSVS